MKRREAVVGWVVALILVGVPSTGQNLVANGEFDVNADGWGLLADGSFEWVAEDRDNCAASGASELTNGMLAPGEAPVQVCVIGLVEGQSYSFGADVRFASGQSVAGSARVQLYFYSDSNCLSSSIGPAFSPPIASDTTDTWLRTENLDAIAPPTTESALLVVFLQKDGADSFVARFDRIFLVPGEGRLFADGFEAGATCRWSAENPLLVEDGRTE